MSTWSMIQLMMLISFKFTKLLSKVKNLWFKPNTVIDVAQKGALLELQVKERPDDVQPFLEKETEEFIAGSNGQQYSLSQRFEWSWKESSNPSFSLLMGAGKFRVWLHNDITASESEGKKTVG